MLRRRLLAALLLCAAAAGAPARTLHLPLDPATLGGASVFTDAESRVAAAARNAGLAFVPDPRPLPPQVVIPLAPSGATVEPTNGLLFWRGDMLPDQLAPAETGTLIRKTRAPDGAWRTRRALDGYALSAHTNLVPVRRRAGPVELPALVIETPYHLGALGDTSATLLLWRSADEGTPPLGGAIAIPNPPPALLDAWNAGAPPFDAQADWAAEFDALSP